MKGLVHAYRNLYFRWDCPCGKENFETQCRSGELVLCQSCFSHYKLEGIHFENGAIVKASGPLKR